MQLHTASSGRQNDWPRITKETQSSTCRDCIAQLYAFAELAARRSTNASTSTQEPTHRQRWATRKRKHEGRMIGLGKRPKSKLPDPSKNTKSTGKQDYLAELMNSKKEKQPWQSA